MHRDNEWFPNEKETKEEKFPVWGENGHYREGGQRRKKKGTKGI